MREQVSRRRPLPRSPLLKRLVSDNGVSVVEVALVLFIAGILGVGTLGANRSLEDSSDRAHAAGRLSSVASALWAVYNEPTPDGTVGFTGWDFSDPDWDRREVLVEKLRATERGFDWVPLREWDPESDAVWVFLLEGCVEANCWLSYRDQVATAGFVQAGRMWCTTLIGAVSRGQEARPLLGAWWDSEELHRLSSEPVTAAVRQDVWESGRFESPTVEHDWPQPAGCIAPHAGNVSNGAMRLASRDPDNPVLRIADVVGGMGRW